MPGGGAVIGVNRSLSMRKMQQVIGMPGGLLWQDRPTGRSNLGVTADITQISDASGLDGVVNLFLNLVEW